MIRILKSFCCVIAASIMVMGLSATAAAETMESSKQATEDSSMLEGLGVGFRVGGYGFRHMNDGEMGWNGCRMDGSGVFATYDFTDHLFAEASLDMYNAIGSVVDEGMDRLSLLQMGAIGVKSKPLWIVTPYIQLGVGTEWTRIDVDDRQSSKWLGLGFVGVGAQAEIGPFAFGANLRSSLMGDAEHDHDDDGEGHHHHVDHGEGVGTQYQAAGHALFFGKFQF